MRNTWRARAGLALRLGLALLIVAVIWRSLDAGLLRSHLELIVLLQVPNGLGLWLAAWRLTVLSGGTVRIWDTTKASSLSGTLGYVLPGRASELVKPFYMLLRCGLPLSRGVAIVGVERFLDVLMVAVLTGAVLVFAGERGLAETALFWGAVAGLGIAFAAVVMRFPRPVLALIQLLPFTPVRNSLTLLMGEVRRTLSPLRLQGAFVMSALIWLCAYVLCHWTVMAIGSIPLTPHQTLFVFLSGAVGLALAIAPGGLGTFEAGIVLALRLYGYDTSEALLISLIMRLANLGFVPFLAVWIMVRERLGLQELMTRMRVAFEDLKKERRDDQPEDRPGIT
jgi:uncharacterized membrane protein YbhN (UPF0104 family)